MATHRDVWLAEEALIQVGLLFHFGPEAKFYRLYAPNVRKAHPRNPAHPPDPK